MEEEIFGALKKCAVGLETKETVEEFSIVDDELKLVKKKVTKRNIPPDIKAVKLLLDGGNIDGLTDGELEEERQKLLKILNSEDIEKWN